MPDELSALQRNRIDEIFATAVNLDPSDQDAFVNAETTSEPALRPYIQKLLEHSKGASDRIAKIIKDIAQSIPSTPQWPGRRVGPYRILQEIGRGGMGIVFEAERDDQEYTKRVA